MEKTTPHRHRVWRCIGYGALGLAGVAALAAGGGAWWLWGWRVGGLSYHESWSPEHRAELATMDDKICHMVEAEVEFIEQLEKSLQSHLEKQPPANDEDELHPDVGWRLYKRMNPLASLPRGWRFVVSSAAMRDMLAEMRAALKEAAASGRGKVCAMRLEQMSLAHAAIRLGQLGLVRELIQRGESPNTALINPADPTIRETLFQSAILCMPFTIGAPIPSVQERKELMEYMLEHGALVDGGQTDEEVERNGHYSAILCATSAMFGEGDGGELFEWLLEHGLTLTPKMSIIAAILRSEGSLPTMRRLHSKGLLGCWAENPQLRAKMLRTLLLESSYTPEIVEKVRWALEELGANPALPVLRDGEADDKNPPREDTPTINLCLCNFYSLDADELSEEKQARATAVLAILDLLLTHGARPENPEDYIPQNAAAREQYLAILTRHGIELATQTPPAESEEDKELFRDLRKKLNKTLNSL